MPRSLAFATVLFSLCTAASAEIPFYSLTDLGPQGATSISKEGSQIVGWQLQNGQQIAHEFAPASMSLGTLPGGLFSQALATNGQKIVGYSLTGTNESDQQQHAFVFENGQMTDFGDDNLDALNADDMCGSFFDQAATTVLPVCWIQGVRTEYPTFPGHYGAINALNEKGNAAGVSRTASGEYHCAFWPVEGGIVDCTGTSFSQARDINASNVIVGDTGGRGFFYFFGAILLNPLPGMQSSRADSYLCC